MPQAVVGILMWVVFFAIFYFFLIRPQKKKDKQLKEMRESLDVGAKVVTIGGIVPPSCRSARLAP
ncbi:preprotein translocase subunit YajC [Brucella abortus]|uniref:preprotein translocase subunit YajC n=1 Tax=Brucella abortus TaxID=235 RepID=UPI00344C905B